jgi:hypothetical protein
MRTVPKELEHLIREALPPDHDPQASKTLSSHLSAIDTRKALEVEHYLRACILRLDVPRSESPLTGWRTV